MRVTFDEEPTTEDLEHFGVKGMKWGVRREARRDARETARAKMFYGEGAGVRRRNIKAVVQQKSKDPNYKKAYDEALGKQDLSSARRAAQKDRKKADKSHSFRKGAGKALRSGMRAAGSMALVGGVTLGVKALIDPQMAGRDVRNAVALGKTVANNAAYYGNLGLKAVKRGANVARGAAFLRNLKLN